MTNEIKELIDNIKKIIKENRKNDFNHIILQSTSMEQLLDYITNLQDKLKWYENIDPNKTIDKFRLEHNMKVKNLHQRIDKAVELLNEPQFENNNIPCNYENDIEKLKNILRGDE